MPGKICELIFFSSDSLHRISPPRGPRSVLWVVEVTTSQYGTGLVNASGDQTRDMGHINHKVRTNFICNRPQTGEVDDPRVGAGAGQ